MMWMDVAFRFWKDSSKFLLISCPKGVRILFTSSFFKIQNLLKKLIIYVLAVLDLHCSLGFALVAARGGHSLVAVFRLLIAVASLVAEHRPSSAWASVAVAPGLWSAGPMAVVHRLSCCTACGIFLDQGSCLLLLLYH